MSIRIGSRLFAPSLLMTFITALLFTLLLSLGRWQLHRADEKKVLFDSFAKGADSSVNIDAGTTPVMRYQHVEATGHFDESRQVLIDNMVSPAGQAGYYVITPFQLTDGRWVLVNRGWVPMGASRRVLPSIPVTQGPVKIRGRSDHLPAAGIELGTKAPLAPPYPVVASYPSFGDLTGLLHEKEWAPLQVIQLDAEEPNGYARTWSPPGFPPLRHVGYAVQWFALSAALLAIYLITNSRRVEPT